MCSLSSLPPIISFYPPLSSCLSLLLPCVFMAWCHAVRAVVRAVKYLSVRVLSAVPPANSKKPGFNTQVWFDETSASPESAGGLALCTDWNLNSTCWYYACEVATVVYQPTTRIRTFTDHFPRRLLRTDKKTHVLFLMSTFNVWILNWHVKSTFCYSAIITKVKWSYWMVFVISTYIILMLTQAWLCDAQRTHAV